MHHLGRLSQIVCELYGYVNLVRILPFREEFLQLRVFQIGLFSGILVNVGLISKVIAEIHNQFI